MKSNKYQDARVKSNVRLRKGDTVKIIAGGHKGKTGRIEQIDIRAGKVFIEKIGQMKRRVKPSQLQPRGGSKEIHKGIAVSNVAIVVDDKGTTSRVGYKESKDGKVRIAKTSGREITAAKTKKGDK